MLGLGTNIPDATGLPTMEADGKIPKDLGKKYGKMILDADGFAQVRCSMSLAAARCVGYVSGCAFYAGMLGCCPVHAQSMLLSLPVWQAV